MRRVIWIVIWAFAGLVNGHPALAQSDETVFMGSRPLAMGGAFTAVADDGNAMFYNPAGLHSLSRHQATFVNSDLYGTGIQAMYASYVMPLSSSQALGVDWQHLGFGDGELGYNRDVIKLAYSRQLHPRVSLGAGVKFLTTNLSLDGTSFGKGLGVGGDVGLLVKVAPRVRVGIGVQDVTGTKARYDGGGSETVLPRSVRGGVAVEVTDDLLLAADVDRKVHVGGEYWVKDLFAVRFGTQKDLRTSDPLELNVGFGMKYKLFQFDITHTPGRRGLGRTQRYGFSATFDPSPHLIKVVDSRANNLYASYYKEYAAKSAGNLTLQNKGSKPLDCVIRVGVSGFSEQFTETQATLAPKTTQSVPFRAVLSDAIMGLREDRPVDLEVQIEYATKRARKTIKRTVSSMAFRPGSLTWDATGKAAAFVTHEDPVVEGFARGVYSQFPEDPPPGVPPKVYQAILVFNALSEYGMRYVEDPENPFSQISQNRQYVDRISYPRDALRIKTGDCDDDVVLYCALLENLNISTAFVEPEGHIFMMFDTGYTVMDDDQPFVEANAGRFFDAQDGKLWLPMEITLLGKPFMEAWDRGAEQMQLLRGQRKFEWAPTRTAWQRFAPAAPPGDAWQPSVPSKSLMEARVQRDLELVMGQMNKETRR